MKWLGSVLKGRLEQFLGTKSIATIAGILLTMLLPGLEAEVKAALITAIVSVYNLARAWQNRAVIESKAPPAEGTPEHEAWLAKIVADWEAKHK